MTRIKGFEPPPRTMPVEALAARLLVDNSRLRKALIRVIAAAEQGAPLATITELAREGLQRLQV